MNLFKRCLQRKLLSLILVGLIVEGFIGFVDITRVFGQPSITLKWTKNAGTGSTWLGPLAADLNNDGRMEIVITGMVGTAALDPISGNVIWKVPYGGGHVPFEIIDLNKDGIPEILMSPQEPINGSSGGVLALHGNNGSVYWYNRNAAGKGMYIAVADINADGYPEIYSASPGKVTALTYDGRIFASTYTYYPCWGGMSIGDTDFDGVFEVYLGERSNTFPPPISPGRGIRAFWADNLTEIWCDPEILCSSQAPELADVDKDGDLEIIILHQRRGVAVYNTDGSVNTYNGIYRRQLSISGFSSGHQNPTVADVDDDGNLELIQCGDASHNAYPPVIFDLVNWKIDTTLPFPSVDPPAVADIDNDAKLEIIAPNAKNVTIFKYNPDTTNYDIIYTILLSNAHPFSIAQDIDGDGKLELVFNQFNSWITVYDVEASAPTPLPRSGRYFYSEYRTRVPVYVPPPDQPPKISEISPSDGATSVPTTLSELSFKLTDDQNDLMNYTVTTNPDTGSASGINVPNGTTITVPVSGLVSSTTYTWNVTVTDGTYTTTITFTFYTEGNVVLTISTLHGSVTKNPENVNNVYAYGTLIWLTAVADTGYTFSRWDGDLAWVGSNNPATILMNGDKTVTAVFIGPRLRTYVSPTGSGIITKIPDQSNYDYLANVELTAVANAGWSFSYWSIANDTSGSPSINSTQNPTTIVMDNNKRVTAVFVEIPPVQYQLTISVTGTGSTSPAVGSYLYDGGTVVSVTAIPDSGWTFDHWVLDAVNVGSANPYAVTMDSNHALGAVFTEVIPPTQYQLTISVSGSGTTDPAVGSYLYDEGTVVPVTAYPASGWMLDHWLLDAVDVGDANPYAVTMDENHTLTAVFVQEQYILTINVSPEGSGTITLNNTGPYYYGDAIQLTAEPNTGWYFSQWEGDLLGSQNPAIIIIDGDKSITAVFTQEKLILNITIIGNGSVIKEPDKAIYIRGETVTLTAVAGPNWTFSGWSGDISGLLNPATITMTGNRTVTATFTINQWWCRDWQYRRTITIDHTKVSGTLTDFSVLIEILDSSLIGKTQPNGYDFVFTDANNVKLDHQIEFYDSTIGHLIVWVKVPYLSSSADTILYMYYGNPTCGNQQNLAAVWDTNYKLVLHLNEKTGIQYDSTINGNNGTPLNGVLQGVSGKIDGADTFDGSNDYIEIPYSDTLSGYTKALTVSFWIRLEDTSRRQTILCKYDTSGNMRSWQIEYDPRDRPNNPFWFFASQNGVTYGEWWASFVPQANTWYYVTIVWETNSIPRFYINGVQVATVGTSTISSIFNNVGVPLYIGRSIYSAREFKGSLDEITISNQARSADWILTAYNNQFNPTAFYSVGAEETFQETYILTLHVDGNGSVTITPEKTAYTQGETVTLTATPGEGYEFQGWSGDITGTDNPAYITMSKNMNIIAIFAPDED